MTFKVCAVIVWLVTLAILIASGSVILNSILNLNLEGVVIFLTGNSAAAAIATGFIVGMVFFGIGELIKLLGDIRRRTR